LKRSGKKREKDGTVRKAQQPSAKLHEIQQSFIKKVSFLLSFLNLEKHGVLDVCREKLQGGRMASLPLLPPPQSVSQPVK
jgi:hypothetical protein